MSKERILMGVEVTKWLRARGIDDYDTFTSEELAETVCDALQHFLKPNGQTSPSTTESGQAPTSSQSSE